MADAEVGSWPMSPADIEFANVVNRVGQRLAAQARRKLPWRFQYVTEPGFFNAFALPGGHIVLGEGLATQIETEDELAAILGHEIEHVDRYHCADRIQVEATARSLPMGGLITLPIAVFQAGYTKDQESEADREGTALAVRAGYSPLGAVHAMQMLADRQAALHGEASAGNHTTNPVEATAAVGLEGIVDYFKSHPDPAERVNAIQALIRDQGWPPVPEKPLIPRAVASPARASAASIAPTPVVTPAMLSGQWTLLSANGHTGRGTGGGQPTTDRRKLYRADTWYVWHPAAGGVGIVMDYGGNYTLENGKYTETVGFANKVTYPNLPVTELSGTATLRGETLTLQFSNGAVEIWRRGVPNEMPARGARQTTAPPVAAPPQQGATPSPPAPPPAKSYVLPLPPGNGEPIPAGQFGAGAYLTGGGVLAPRMLQQVRPNYTEQAMRARIGGLVVMNAVVQRDGSVGDIDVVQTLDVRYGLDAEAVRALKQWRFAPGTKDGQPVPVVIQVELEFAVH
jgi:TonB family protein